ncbi:MAG: hypothetical protein IPK13_27180 [Deltaproteobacteria bacterium]|nr:hypothetical protein [Deltaproteobacteria bacterium]
MTQSKRLHRPATTFALLLAFFGNAASVDRASADVAPAPRASVTNLQRPPSAKRKPPAVRMEEEEVTISLYPLFAIVRATFVMKNTGATFNDEIGFPGAGVPVGGQFAAHVALRGFRAWIDGKAAKTAERLIRNEYAFGPPKRGGGRYTRTREETWHVFTAHIPKRKSVTITVEYAVLSEQHDVPDAQPLAKMHYILHTGRSWKGPIGSGVVRIVAEEGVDPASISTVNHAFRGLSNTTKYEPFVLPKGASRTDNGFEWKFTQLSPTEKDDLEIVYRVDEAARNADAEAALSRALKTRARSDLGAGKQPPLLGPIRSHR